MVIAGRQIDRSGAKRNAVSKTQTIPAPVGGLNAQDSLAAMAPTDAGIMDNWFPQTSYVELRNGYTKWATGLPSWAETIMAYSGTSEKLFAISSTSVYDVTANAAVGAPVVTGLTNARWEWTNVTTAGGFFLYAANAVDDPLLYDGTSWTKITGVSTPAITGVTTTQLRNPIVWKNRVWFVQNNTTSAWYLPPASIGGAALQFNLGAIFRLGGTLQAITTASLTNGSIFDDYIIFISSEGEVAIYGGTDPSQAGLFNIQGVYRVGKPIGRRCAFRYGNDTVIICSDGLVSLQKVISVSFLGKAQTISEKIELLVNEDLQSYGTNFGWEGLAHPLGNKIIINVPTNELSTMTQYVQSTLNNSWCTIGRNNSPWNFTTFATLGDSLYGGANGFVALADQGQIDDTSAIIVSLKAAFNYLGTDTQKDIKQVRPIIQTTGTIQPVLGVDVDFGDMVPTQIPGFTSSPGSPWNVSPWDTSPWSSGFQIQKNWQTVSGIGFSIALYLIVASNSEQVRFLSYDYIFEPGSVY